MALNMDALLRERGAPPAPNLALQFRPPGFKRIQRQQIYKDKLTVSADEIVPRLEICLKLAGYAGSVKISTMDDSLFFMQTRQK
jgi:hypothetical protein